MGIAVTVVWSPEARVVLEHRCLLPDGATAEQAIAAALADPAWAGCEVSALQLGVWGKSVAPGHVLCDGDRIELCRPLAVDPKVARRERFRQQGVGSAGLFAKRRPGGKAGY